MIRCDECDMAPDCPCYRRVPPGGGFVSAVILGLLMWAIIIAGVSVWLSGT
jgi:hypothetical protein